MIGNEVANKDRIKTLIFRKSGLHNKTSTRLPGESHPCRMCRWAQDQVQILLPLPLSALQVDMLSHLTFESCVQHYSSLLGVSLFLLSLFSFLWECFHITLTILSFTVCGFSIFFKSFSGNLSNASWLEFFLCLLTLCCRE